MTGWTVILIDDVMTTGTTLAACCGALKQRGVHRVHVGVIAVAGASRG
jgi:predicted amidophosphoribosyltransferase